MLTAFVSPVFCLPRGRLSGLQPFRLQTTLVDHVVVVIIWRRQNYFFVSAAFLMVAWRGRVRSGDEPAAFRIDRHGEPETYASDWDLQFGPRSTDVPSRTSRYSSRTANVIPDMHGVNSINFKAHEFVQRMLEERADKPLRSVHTGHGDNSFDADSALAALDSIEYVLQKRRDIALKDEQGAREDLRQQLHSSLKKTRRSHESCRLSCCGHECHGG